MANVNRRWMLAAGAAMGTWATGAAVGAAEPKPSIAGRLTEGEPNSGAVEGKVQALTAIRERIGGRLGVHWYDTETGERIGLDDGSRYAMASTFKMLLAAAVLSKVDHGELTLAQKLIYNEKDLLPTSPITREHAVEGGLAIQQLCEAIVTVSDNLAANLLLKQIGGPEGFTAFVRTLGDRETRLDRYEMELNSNLPGDPRDTTTPRAMVGSMEQVLVKNALSESSRRMLLEWMVASPTGLKRIRAGLPAGWKAGDKTGTGANGAVNDLGILWPPGRSKPVLMAVYLSESKKSTDELAVAHADIARVLTSG